MKVKIDIETQTFVRFWLVVIGFAAVLGAIYVARDALMTVAAACFLALALNPPVSWLSAKLPGKSRVGATAIAYLLVVALLGAVVFLVVPPIIEQTAKFADTVPSLIDKATSQRPLLDDFIDHYNLREAVNQSIDSVKSQASEMSKQIGLVLVGTVTGAFGWLANLFFILVLGFFMLVEGPMWIKKIWGLYEDSEKLEAHRATVEKMYRVITGFVNGQIAVSAVGASFVFVTLLIMSLFSNLATPVNLALPLAVIVFIMELIPMIGATLALVLVGLILLLNSPFAALIFALLYLVYQQVENNIITPHIQSKNVELSVLWIITALLIGASLFGLVGGLVAIPIAGCVRVLLMDYLDYAKKRRAAQKPKGALAKLIHKAAREE